MKKFLLTRLPFFAFVAFLISMSSCNVLNPNIMLRTPKGYVFDTLEKDTTISKEFRLAGNDVIEFRLFANDGFKLVDVISSNSGSGSGPNGASILRQGFEYTLDNHGVVKLPIIGEENLSGMTIRDAEAYLEERYSEYYVKPFVILKVVNKRIIVYPGEPGMAKVISISNNNTTVNEAIALAGGISADGKAYNVKLIRKTDDAKRPYKVYKLNLAKIETGLTQGNTIVQSGDMIYVEPRRQIAGRALREVTPIITLATSLITFYYVITRL